MEEAEYLIDRPKYFADKFWKPARIQAKSHIIRIMLLSIYGVFADASSSFCRKPLRNWVDLGMVQDMISVIRHDYDRMKVEMMGPIIDTWLTSWFMVALAKLVCDPKDTIGNN